MSRVLGIDIGNRGAIALLDGPDLGLKDLSRAAAVRRWPSHAALLARHGDDGRAFTGMERDRRAAA